ncbi:expressed unknown protein [Seminavis robusta]|uniref:Transmembrane protein n=1 Tax=Seminavis robusta TaxID=568900 RepID=A0A9N8EU81_9STRA|nr:expressed unknown protein [Seminavis robusta]|eukprot:Sro1699_g292070.1 n/a (219) ;mRNA; r:19725-20464
MARSLLLGWMLFAVVAHHMSNDQQNLKKLHQRWLAASSSSTEDGCVLAEECKLCDAALRSEITECRETGRVEIWKCSNDAGLPTTTTIATTSTTTTSVSASVGVGPLYRSCLRTKSDEEFLMVRLQVIWVVLGTAAFVLSRKQKSLSASLFDQRKLASQQAQAQQQQQSTTSTPGQKKRRTSAYNTSSSALTHENNIEMTKIEQQETMPLTMDAVDVV